ncbi:MAG: hemolysin III family protein [Candidatus Omnitrophota bacterium]
MFEWINNLREPINGFTHIIGAVLSIAGLVILVWRAAYEKKARHIVAFSIYGFSQIALYTMSALYHSLTVSPGAIAIFQQVEHAMIYFLIAGTYTPLCLIVLRGKWGWSLFGVNWGLAIAGMCLKLTLRHPPQSVIVTFFSFFIIMGWLIVIAWRPLVKTLPKPGIRWLVAGGLFYTFGAIILGMKNLYLGFGFGPHQIWHIFVMAGGLCIFWLMYKYLLPMRQ